ncbi:MAG: hypothetical protein ABFD84_17115 [Candidatus Polarisedimenticolia bacterium]
MSAFLVYGPRHYWRDPGYYAEEHDMPFLGCAPSKYHTKYATVIMKERRGRRFVAFDETWLEDRP